MSTDLVRRAQSGDHDAFAALAAAAIARLHRTARLIGETDGSHSPGHAACRGRGRRLCRSCCAVCPTLAGRAAVDFDAGHDETIKGDYFADAGDPRVEKNVALDAHLTTGTP